MKKIITTGAIALLMAAGIAFAAPATKVTVAHNVDGNTQYICISANAWPAHKAHGDKIVGKGCQKKK